MIDNCDNVYFIVGDVVTVNVVEITASLYSSFVHAKFAVSISFRTVLNGDVFFLQRVDATIVLRLAMKLRARSLVTLISAKNHHFCIPY